MSYHDFTPKTDAGKIGKAQHSPHKEINVAVRPDEKLTPEQEAFLRKMVAYFTEQGWKPAMIFGLASNMYAETSFRPTLWGDGKKAYGLCQWHPERRSAFERKYGVPMHRAPVERQFDFVIHEMYGKDGGEAKAGVLLKAAVNAYDAAAIICKHYERPAKDERYNRGIFAQTLYDRYGPEAAAAPIA